MSRRLGLLLAVLAISTSACAATVKKSQSGICHSPDSPWYAKTQNFVPFNSLDACLQSGGVCRADSRGRGINSPGHLNPLNTNANTLATVGKTLTMTAKTRGPNCWSNSQPSRLPIVETGAVP